MQRMPTLCSMRCCARGTVKPGSARLAVCRVCYGITIDELALKLCLMGSRMSAGMRRSMPVMPPRGISLAGQLKHYMG